MDLHELEKMTVVKLREEAHKFEDIKDASGMSKDQLIDILCKKHGIERKHALRKGIGRHALKERIASLKAERTKAIEGGDARAALVQRSRLKTARRRLRKVIREAKRIEARTPQATPAEPAAPAETPAS